MRVLPIVLLLLVVAVSDGICDVCEPSTTADTTEAALRVRGVPPPVGDERMRFSGRFRFESSDFVDPAVAGLRFSLHGEVSTDAETQITPMIAAHIPGGAGWRSSNGRWHFRDSKGLNGGITTVTLKVVMPAPLVPGDTRMSLAYRIDARRGSYVVTPDMIRRRESASTPSWGKLVTQMALGSTADGSSTCAQAAFPSSITDPANELLTVPCAPDRRGNTFTCNTPPPIGPCRVGAPRDVLVCDLLSIVAAIDKHKAAHGGVYSLQSCDDVPDYTPANEFILCILSSALDSFKVGMATPLVPHLACYYDSAATPAFYCSPF